MTTADTWLVHQPGLNRLPQMASCADERSARQIADALNRANQEDGP